MLLDSLVLCRDGERIDLYFGVVFSGGQIKLSHTIVSIKR